MSDWTDIELDKRIVALEQAVKTHIDTESSLHALARKIKCDFRNNSSSTDVWSDVKGARQHLKEEKYRLQSAKVWPAPTDGKVE